MDEFRGVDRLPGSIHVSDSGLCDTATPKSSAGQVKARGEDAFAWRCKIEMCETGCKIYRFERSPLRVLVCASVGSLRVVLNMLA